MQRRSNEHLYSKKWNVENHIECFGSAIDEPENQDVAVNDVTLILSGTVRASAFESSGYRM